MDERGPSEKSACLPVGSYIISLICQGGRSVRDVGKILTAGTKVYALIEIFQEDAMSSGAVPNKNQSEIIPVREIFFDVTLNSI